MDETTAAKAFEPLFTTRARGVGLGLAVVRKVAEEHRGTVIMKSDPGLGTRITLTIPFWKASRGAGVESDEAADGSENE